MLPEFAIQVTINDWTEQRKRKYYAFVSIVRNQKHAVGFDFEIHLKIQHANTNLRILIFKYFRNCGNAWRFYGWIECAFA